MRECLRGHAWEGNRVYSLGTHGKPQSSCRLCHNVRMKAKYRADPAYRERKKAQRMKAKGKSHAQ